MLDTSALNLHSKFNALWGFCEAAVTVNHKGPEWKRLKMFSESILSSIKSGQFNEADTGGLLASFVSLTDLWDNSLARLTERAGSAPRDC